jgi:hypothetical protein
VSTLFNSVEPEADIVVPVVGVVPVALGRAEILRIVVPGTAAQDTATRGRPGFRDSYRNQTGCLGMPQGLSAARESKQARASQIPRFLKNRFRAYGAGFKR